MIQASPLFQLQVLFTFLQTSRQASYNPKALVQSLKLDAAEQQDAQEFSKLFLHLLDHEFQKEVRTAERDVARLVENQVSRVAFTLHISQASWGRGVLTKNGTLV